MYVISYYIYLYLSKLILFDKNMTFYHPTKHRAVFRLRNGAAAASRHGAMAHLVAQHRAQQQELVARNHRHAHLTG